MVVAVLYDAPSGECYRTTIIIRVLSAAKLVQMTSSPYHLDILQLSPLSGVCSMAAGVGKLVLASAGGPVCAIQCSPRRAFITSRRAPVDIDFYPPPSAPCNGLVPLGRRSPQVVIDVVLQLRGGNTDAAPYPHTLSPLKFRPFPSWPITVVISQTLPASPATSPPSEGSRLTSAGDNHFRFRLRRCRPEARRR
jgi:hypothetical protein